MLAYSSAKATAAVTLTALEQRALGGQQRQLILCDHERAGATLPLSLTGIVEKQTGSALDVIGRLVADPETGPLNPLLVTGKLVCGSEPTVTALHEHVRSQDPELAAGLVVQDEAEGLVRLSGAWQSRQWVAWVSEYFHLGHCQVLVGTRGLLGEGWDARRITGLIDLTTATTATAVVQTRGRSLRVDPFWPDKVAVNWTIACVEPDHPLGGNDWGRLVRKHTGFVGPDADGNLVDGVAHLDSSFSPYSPPTAEEYAAANARAVVRSEDRTTLRELWQIGTPYADQVVRTVWLHTRRAGSLGDSRAAAGSTLDSQGAFTPRVRPSRWPIPAALGIGSTAAGALLAFSDPAIGGAALGIGAVVAAGEEVRRRLTDGHALLADAARVPSVHQFAAAVADGLVAAGLGSVGAPGVRVDIDSFGEYRCWLTGAGEGEAAIFATALAEVTGEVWSPRYLISRPVLTRPSSLARMWKAGSGHLQPDGLSWHAVPTSLATHAKRAKPFGSAWRLWLGGNGIPLFTGSPEGAGVLVAQQGANPLEITSVMRDQWE